MTSRLWGGQERAVEILTPRLRLRRARTDDLEGMHAVLSDASAMRYWSTPPHANREETRAWLERMIASPAETSDDFVVEFEGNVIGKAGCWKVPEIGFIFHPRAWGKGLGREAVAAVIKRTFALFPIDAVEAETDPRNDACLALLAKLGFHEVRRAQRTMRVGDEWVDSVYLALPRPCPSGCP
jgi:RimJ/RimL family protein N-acetyltransferase